MALPDDDRRRLLAAMERHGIAALVYEDAERSLSLSRERTAQPHLSIRASQAGRFYARHPARPDAGGIPCPVVAGDCVGFLKIGGLILPVNAAADGMLGAPLLEDGTLVGFGDILF